MHQELEEEELDSPLCAKQGAGQTLQRVELNIETVKTSNRVSQNIFPLSLEDIVEDLVEHCFEQRWVFSALKKETATNAFVFCWEKEHYINAGIKKSSPPFFQDMDPSIPHPLTILGQPVVLWYDRNEAKWRCFLDQCPHRLAPLSEGRIDEEGRLQCSYHGWSFEGRGGCSCIPQVNIKYVKVFIEELLVVAGEFLMVGPSLRASGSYHFKLSSRGGQVGRSAPTTNR